MNQKIDQLHVVFENCEVIEVPYSDVRYISMGDISEYMWDNNILHEESFEFKLKKRAKFMRLMIKNKPEYKRILEHDDITHIDFMCNGESICYIGIDWVEGSSDWSNVGQKVDIDKKQEMIDILIDQKDFTK